MTETLIKHGRFRRGTEEVLFRITNRDIEILRVVAKHRFLTSVQIARLVSHLFEGSEAHAKTRLTKLFRAGFLDKPKQQLQYYEANGSRVHVYGLSNKGARLVTKKTDLELGKINWSSNNRRAGQDYIWHTTGIAEVMVGMEMSARQRPKVRLVERPDLLKTTSATVQGLKNPWRFEGSVVRGSRARLTAVFPDEVFSLEIIETEKTERVNFVLERDRGTMPVVRSERLLRELLALQKEVSKGENREQKARGMMAIEKARMTLIEANAFERQSCFMKKFIAYVYGWKADPKWHTERFNWKQFRVLTVTTSQKRIETMQQALSIVTGGSLAGMFLFATEDQVDQVEDLLSIERQDGKGEPVLLLND